MAEQSSDRELDLIEPTDREMALQRMADIKEDEQLRAFQRSFLACCKKFLNINKSQLEQFKEAELPEVGDLLAEKSAPWAALQRAAMGGLAVLNVAVPAGFAYAVHPIMLLLALPVTAVSLFVWKSIGASDSLSYQKARAELKKVGGAEYFPPKNFLLSLDPDRISVPKRPKLGENIVLQESTSSKDLEELDRK